MYVKPRCPHCQRAREGLSAEGLEWEERDATTRREWRDELDRYSGGTRVVPTIVSAEDVMVGWQGRG